MPLFSPSVNAGRFLPWIYTRLCVTGKYFAPSHSRSAKGRHWAETPLYAPTETAHFSLLSSLPTSSSCFKPAPLPIFCFSPSCLASWKGPIASHTFPPSFLDSCVQCLRPQPWRTWTTWLSTSFSYCYCFENVLYLTVYQVYNWSYHISNSK